MVTVTYFFIVIPCLIQGAISKATDSPGASPTESPFIRHDYDYYGTFDYPSYGAYDYGKQYTDYVKQYDDYVKQYGDYGPHYADYGAYDYGSAWQYEDYGYYEDDYTSEYDYYGFGDRNNPMDTVMHLYDDSGLIQMPWIYIIVPVVQIDVFYVDDEHHIEDVEFQLPIETFLFELGDFGMGHLGLGDFGLGELELDYGLDYAIGADYLDYADYPLYGHYPSYESKPELFDTGDELNDFSTLDYPGIDHEPYWVNWIFMLPPDDVIPVR